jgi:hypothetical protein
LENGQFNCSFARAVHLVCYQCWKAASSKTLFERRGKVLCSLKKKFFFERMEEKGEGGIVAEFTSTYRADVVEFCPFCDSSELFVVGTYQLFEDKGNKTGQLLLFETPTDTIKYYILNFVEQAS